MKISGKKVRLTAVLLCCAAVSVTAAARSGEAVTPSVAAFTKSEKAGERVCFSPEDFTGMVRGKEALSAIVISDLPEAGSLMLAGSELQLGQAVETQQLGALCYLPEEAEETDACFSFLPVFSETGAGEHCATVSLHLSQEKNAAPIAVALEYETYADLPLCGCCKAVDPEGEPCSFEIVSQGKKGSAEITETGFCYTPSGKSGEDRFSYVAVDCWGNRSQPAEITVKVIKRARKECFSYTDMSGDPAHFAAIRLREAGVFSGEQIGDYAFFCPEKPVTRAEFLTMAARLTELPLPAAAVSTGLSDQENIPAWARSSVAAGLSCGMVRGNRDSFGNCVFRAEQPITRAEAAAILCRACCLPEDGRELLYSDASAIPTWAEQSVRSTTAAGILPVFSDGTVRASDTVTRADAAMMLYQTMLLQK